jgi:hypothetical protein
VWFRLRRQGEREEVWSFGKCLCVCTDEIKSPILPVIPLSCMHLPQIPLPRDVTNALDASLCVYLQVVTL